MSSQESNFKLQTSNFKLQQSSLLRSSTIYGLGLVVNRALDFALLPLYTNYFTPDEYGAIALTLTLLGFGHVVYALGFGPAFLRYFSLHDDADRRRMFLGATLTLIVVAFALSACLFVYTAPVARWFGLGSHSSLIRLAAGILILDALTLLPYSILRTEERSSCFVVCTFITTVVHVGLTAYFILIVRMGIEAIFIAMLVSSALNAIIVTASVRHYVTFRIRPVMPVELLRFGFPFIPAGLATVAMDLIDRVILERLMDTTTVGVYSAGYKIAAGMGLIVRAFDYAWAPFILARRDEARRVIVQAILGFIGVTGMIWLAFWLFGEEILGIRIAGTDIIGPAYRAGAVIIPPVMFAYILGGIAEILMAGVYLRGRSWIVPAATILAAGINIGGNYLLIPTLGMMGAAYATIMSYAVLAMILFAYTRRVMESQPQMDTNIH